MARPGCRQAANRTCVPSRSVSGHDEGVCGMFHNTGYLQSLPGPDDRAGARDRKGSSQPAMFRAPLKVVEFGLPATPLGVGSQLAGSYHVTLWSLTS